MTSTNDLPTDLTHLGRIYFIKKSVPNLSIQVQNNNFRQTAGGFVSTIHNITINIINFKLHRNWLRCYFTFWWDLRFGSAKTKLTKQNSHNRDIFHELQALAITARFFSTPCSLALTPSADIDASVVLVVLNKGAYGTDRVNNNAPVVNHNQSLTCSEEGRLL